MNSIFDVEAPRKATNVSVNSDLLAKARSLKINLSATLERALAEQVSAHQRESWKLRHRDAIAAYNELVTTHAGPGDKLRTF
ncbi:MAG: type II toxin-antitoxin system CcdA family antitoxin [Burkholderiaceae bacterium]|nr:type II toxin-antitoxin system CcdA family antitoxin [Burkholderiaceae bacterium]